VHTEIAAAVFEEYDALVLLLCDESGRIVEASPSFIKLVSSEESSVPENILEVLLPESLEVWREMRSRRTTGILHLLDLDQCVISLRCRTFETEQGILLIGSLVRTTAGNTVPSLTLSRNRMQALLLNRIAREEELFVEIRHTMGYFSSLLDQITGGETGPHRLRARESEILTLLGQLGSRKAVAEKLGISLSTVDKHVASIRRRLRLKPGLSPAAISRTTDVPNPEPGTSLEAVQKSVLRINALLDTLILASPNGPVHSAHLTLRERGVLSLVLEGKSNREIAGILYISTATVKSHISSLFRKLGVRSRHELHRFLKE
jgi:DNA-binding CsgD family transcriptional regulator